MSKRLPTTVTDLDITELTRLINRINKCTDIQDETSKCIPWKGRLGNSGHARIYFRGKEIQATRVLWFLFYSKWPSKRKVLRHTCDNAKCVNLAHIIIGTQKQNVKDCIERERFKGTENLLQRRR